MSFISKIQNHPLVKVTSGRLISLVLLLTSLSARSTRIDFLENNHFINRMMCSNSKIPAAYIPHGGGPLPILGDPEHKDMVAWLTKFVDTYLSGEKKPSSCLVISAHWEEREPTVLSGRTTSLYYDYYGFPKETYNLKYTLPGAQDLAKRVDQLLTEANISHKIDNERGYDHGVFIPMKVMYPTGEIPTIQLSLVKGFDPTMHIKIGEALAPLRKEGVFILGSGMSYHNMRGFSNGESNKDSEIFHEFLRNSLVKEGNYEKRVDALRNWSKGPKARECHPREEHLIPLHVILGTSKDDQSVSEPFFANVSGVKCAGYIFE